MRRYALACLVLASCGRSVPPPPLPAPIPRESGKKNPSPAAPGFSLDDVRGDALASHVAKPEILGNLEHRLLVFVASGRELGARALAHYKGEGGTSNAGDTLYVLWGRRIGTPAAEAVLDRRTRRIVVTVRWAGAPGMKMVRGSPYAGFGFRLNSLEAGEYGVWVREVTPAHEGDPKLTAAVTFRVDR